jgi:hypothetical protein
MEINDFLVWLTGGGFIIATSWVLGQFDWYNMLAEKTRQLVFFAISAVIGGGSYAVVTYVPQETLLSIAPYFLIVSTVFTYIFIDKMYQKLSAVYKLTMMREEREKNVKKGR